MAEKQLSVLIIGAGNKGAFGPVSHAEAFTKNPVFKVVGFVDTDREKARLAITRWGGQACFDLDYAFRCLNSVDVAVVATPDHTHHDILYELVGKPVRLIFAEKPFTNSLIGAKILASMFKDKGQLVAVNYTRRFFSEFIDLKIKINSQWGKFLGGTAFYTKGLHNLCHWVDTFLMWGIDPEVIQYVEIDRSKLNVFESFLYFKNGRLDITNNGTYWQFTDAIEREDFPEKIVGKKTMLYGQCSLKIAANRAAQNIADHLIKGAPLLSTSENAVKVLEVCERILA